MKPIMYTAAVLILSCAFNSYGTVYAGWAVGYPTGGYATIIRTIDSGNTWYRQGSSQVANVKMSGVCAVDPITAWVVGDIDAGYATIYHTADGGSTWTRMGYGQPALQNIPLGKVHVSSNHIWAVGTGAILHSADGGTNWENRVPDSHTNVLLQGVYSLNGATVWVGGAGTSQHDYATIFKSTDAGQSWTRLTGGSITGANHIIGISAANEDTAWAVGGGGYLVYRTLDGGTNWQQQYKSGDYGDANEVSAVNTRSVWVAADNFVNWSTNSGQGWSSHTTPFYTMGISAVNQQETWAVICDSIYGTGTIRHTDSGGASWEAQGLPAGQVLAKLWTVSFSRMPIPEPVCMMLMIAATGSAFYKRKIKQYDT